MSIDLNKLREKYASMNKQGGGNNQDFLEKFFMLDEGEAYVRILPWDRDDQDWYAESAIHRINGRNFHCRKVKDEECPVCDAYYAAWKRIEATGGHNAGNNEDAATAARALRGNKRYYVNCIDRRTGDVKILSMGQKLFNKILQTALDEDYIGDNGETVFDLKEGNDLKIVKEKIGGYPNYDKSAFRPKKTPAATDAEISAAMDELHDIHSLVRIGDYGDMKEFADETSALINQIISPSSSPTQSSESNEGDDDDYLSHLNSDLQF